MHGVHNVQSEQCAARAVHNVQCQACAERGGGGGVTASHAPTASFQLQLWLQRFCNRRPCSPTAFPTVANRFHKRWLHCPVASLSFRRRPAQSAKRTMHSVQGAAAAVSWWTVCWSAVCSVPCAVCRVRTAQCTEGPSPLARSHTRT